MLKAGNPRGRPPKAIINKGANSQMLPSRTALAQLTKGSPIQRSLGNYAKLTPSGASALPTYDSITAMGQNNDG